MTGSGNALPGVFESASCSTGFDGSCIRGGGGELPPTGLDLRLGEREGLRFLSRFIGDLRRGDGDLDFRLNKIFMLCDTQIQLPSTNAYLKDILLPPWAL